jgi:hypothetical protein
MTSSETRISARRTQRLILALVARDLMAFSSLVRGHTICRLAARTHAGDRRWHLPATLLLLQKKVNIAVRTGVQERN